MSTTAKENKAVADALQLLSQGNIAGARRQLEIVARTPNASRAAWQALANACSRGGDFAAARMAVERAMQIGPVDANLLLMASNVAQDQRDLVAALGFAEQSVKLDANFAQGYNNLGILLSDAQRFEDSVRAFERAISLKPDYVRAFANLSATLLRLERFQESAECAAKAIKLQPEYAHAHYMHGAALFHLSYFDESLVHIERALTLDPRIADAWMVAARIFKHKALFDKFEIALARVLALTPQRADAKLILGEVLWNKNQFPEALALWQEVLAQAPHKLEPQLRLALSLPGIYRDAADVERARSGLVASLSRLRQNLGAFANVPTKDMLREILFNNFFLAYQGRDDKVIQRDYADFVFALLAPRLPQAFAPITPRPIVKRRIRIGFVSSLLYGSTVGNYFASWITDLPRESIETIVFYTGERTDHVTKTVIAHAERFVQGDLSIERLAFAVQSEALDILVYPELGMDPKIFVLAAMRLAPIQVCAWGHPMTPGHRNIDYYLSCAEMEPENAQQHYSEKLHLLPGLGTRYAMPAAPTGDAANKQREDFLLPANKTLYLLPQSLFKIHPDNDALITALLKQDPNSVLVMFAAPYDAWTQAFVARLSSAFAKIGMPTTGRVKVLPSMLHDDYKRVNQLCDVMVDTLYWSGGNTSLDALAMGLPMVTMRGEFMRGRQSAAMLSMMGIDELIAKDEVDYLRIALRLGNDLGYRRSMADRIAANRHKIFNDPKPIAALVEFFKDIVANAIANHAC
jgi:protein O-GlcNAc transferase